MVFQEWLNEKYPNKGKVEEIELRNLKFKQPSELIIDDGYFNLKWIDGYNAFSLTSLTISNCPRLEIIRINYSKDLQQLTLNNLPNLKKLNCRNNNLTSLEIINCDNLQEINCSTNQLIEIKLPKGEKLEILYLDSNQLNQDLAFLKNLVNLKELYLGKNKFTGGLGFLKNLNRLWKLHIIDTDIDSGLEYLSEKVEQFACSTYERKDAKCQNIYNLLANDQGRENCGWTMNFPRKFQDWKQANPDLVKNAQQISELEKILDNLNLALTDGKIENENTSKALDVFQFETEERIITMKKQNQEYYQARVVHNLPKNNIF